MGAALLRLHGQGQGAAAQASAEAGRAGSAGALPWGAQIQRSFGRHDIAQTPTWQGESASQAARQLGASAYASQGGIVFGQAPDLRTAAHEAAHIIQQRSAAVPAEGLGARADQHERHADEVAERVVRGESAEDLLDQYEGQAGRTSALVQRQELISIGDDEALSPHLEVSPEGTTPGEQLCGPEDEEHRRWCEDWVKRVSALINPMWSSKRATGNFILTQEEGAQINALYIEQRNYFAQNKLQKTHEEHIQSTIPEKTRKYIEEMAAFHITSPNVSLASLRDVLGIPRINIYHKYTLSAAFGISPATDFIAEKIKDKMGTSGAAFLSPVLEYASFRISYSAPEIDLQWHQILHCAKIGVSLEESFSLGVEGGGLTTGSLPALQIPSTQFDIGPITFNSPAAVQMTNYITPEALSFSTIGFATAGKVDLTMASGSLIDQITIYVENERMTFDTSGWNFQPSIKVGATGLSAGGGVCFASEDADNYNISPVEGAEEVAEFSSHERLMATLSVYFKTGDDQPGPEQLTAIENLKAEIKKRNSKYNAEFKINITGKSSARWRNCSPSEVQAGENQTECRLRKNSELASYRALNLDEAFQSLNAEIQDISIDLNIETQQETTHTGGENDPQWRAVDIQIYWTPCASQSQQINKNQSSNSGNSLSYHLHSILQ